MTPAGATARARANLRGAEVSHGIRVEDIAWQAFQAAAQLWNHTATPTQFRAWWAERIRQECALPTCEKCGYDPGAKVTASWTLHVDRDPPSLNDRVFNAGPRRWRYKRERDAWGWEIRAARLLQRVPTATSRRRVTLTRVYSGRQQERDVDNLAGGMKAVVDALVLERLLVGDEPAHAELHYAQERGTPIGLRILIEELA